MGAEPAWFLLALTMPAADESFLEAFAGGMLELAAEHDMAMVGGDTTAGPLTVSVQALGFVAPGRALRRSGGKPGDLLYVSGTPGDAAAGLQLAIGREPATALDAAQRQWLLRSLQLSRRRESRWGARCADSPRPASTSRMDWPRMPASSPRPAVARSVIEVERLPLSAPLRALRGRCRSGRSGADRRRRLRIMFHRCAAQRAAELRGIARANVKCAVTCIGHLAVRRRHYVVRSLVWRSSQADSLRYDHFRVRIDMRHRRRVTATRWRMSLCCDGTREPDPRQCPAPQHQQPVPPRSPLRPGSSRAHRQVRDRP